MVAEIEKAREFIYKKRDWQTRNEPLPLAFYDGTLLLSVTDFHDQLIELARLSRTEGVARPAADGTWRGAADDCRG